MKFAFFYMAEYTHMVLASSLVVILFFGGWLPPFPSVAALAFLHKIPGFIWYLIKIMFFLYLYVWIHSSGNHAQALALAARMRGIPAYIVMPENAPQVKKDAVAGYGGEITYCAPTLAAREATLRRVVERTGAAFIHPFDNERVIAGQGTAALELLEDMPNLDAIVALIGGGGLMSGIGIAATGIKPGIRVIAGEPELADDAYRSLREGKILPSDDPKTIADVLLTSLGKLTFPILKSRLEQIVTVSEQGIIDSIKFIWERAKIVIEPSAAVAVGVLLEKKFNLTGL